MNFADDLQNALLAVLFSSTEAITSKKLAEIFETDTKKIDASLHDLKKSMEDNDCGIVLKQIAGGWRLFSSAKYTDLVKKYVMSLDSRKLSNAAIETLAIIAYSQPVTRANIAAVRGVNSDSSVNVLIEKGLIREVGTADSPGNPTLYATTSLFLEYFGLNSVRDLPSIEQFAPDENTRKLIDESLSAAHIELEGSVDNDLSNTSEDTCSKDGSKQASQHTSQHASQHTSEPEKQDSNFMFETALQNVFSTTEKIDFDKLSLNTDDE